MRMYARVHAYSLARLSEPCLPLDLFLNPPSQPHTSHNTQSKIPNKGKSARTHIIPRNDTIQKLQPTNNDQKPHKRINQLRPLRRVADVSIPDPLQDGLRVIAVLDADAGVRRQR